MPTLLDILEPEAILLDVRATTAEEVIRLLAARLETLGYVKTTYADAVVSREKNLPTGLPLGRTKMSPCRIPIRSM